MYIPHRFARQHEFHQRLLADGLGKGKSLPTVAKAPSSLRKRDTSKDCLNSQEQPVPKMLKVTTPVSRSANVRLVHPLNIPESTEALQERCQTRATEAEHNLACVRLEDGANHSTIKSLTSRVDPSCDALNDLSNFLELSPRSRNKAFPPLPDLATLNSIPGICGDQNLDNDIIGALFDDNDRTMSILSGSGEIFPLVDGENANPCEGEVNSKTNPSCAIQARQEAINNSVRNTLPEPYGPGEAQSPRLMPMFSSVSGIFH
ncbi:unnamed protein product [Ilex paraguariensis]|uniref:Uncharacterized protein n=1 Tax=Ilex paraguariensis TaxID=185542 RepID=A0ABC8SNK7_9AQUA